MLSQGDFQHHSTSLTASCEKSATIQGWIWQNIFSIAYEPRLYNENMWKLPGMEMHLMWQTYGTSHWCRHSLLLPDSLPDSKIQTPMEGDTPNSHCYCDPGGSLGIPRKHLSVYFDGKREGEVSLFQRTQIPWALDSHSIGLLLIPTAPLSTGYCKLGLQKTQPGHFMNAEKMSKYSQKGNEPVIWGHGSLPAQGFPAAEKSAGEIPDCSLSRERLRMSVFKAYSLQHQLKTLFSVKCLICW